MLLAARDLAIGYGSHVVGRDISLSLGAGEVLSLLGPNGSGKTTLFRTLLGLLPRIAGEIAIAGRPLASLGRREIARMIAYVPQTHAVQFPYSVGDVVLMGRTAHHGAFAGPGRRDRERAAEALDILGIADLALRDYSRVSGGQRQLALIARALAQDAPVIVMDEPTASLDFGNQVVVLNEIRRLAARGLAVVLSTHNPDHAFICAQSVLVLHEGAARAAGPPRQVLTAALLSEVYGVDVTVERLASGHYVCAPAIGEGAA
ncbi:MAG: ABC transporter ATP-binding protein [Hyphomicrobiales bacterium]|nr:ABC transporter ATP-binding protein [Hyphomicrobiales bacterium]